MKKDDENVKNEEGGVLHDKDLVDPDQKLFVQCPNGHKLHVTWNQWKKDKRCPYCKLEEGIDKISLKKKNSLLSEIIEEELGKYEDEVHVEKIEGEYFISTFYSAITLEKDGVLLVSFEIGTPPHIAAGQIKVLSEIKNGPKIEIMECFKYDSLGNMLWEDVNGSWNYPGKEKSALGKYTDDCLEQRIDVQKVIQIHGVFEGDGDDVVLNYHTHGLEEFGYPNLTIYASPLLKGSAVTLLNNISDWLINDFTGVKDGETLEKHVVTLDEFPPIFFTPITVFDENVLLLDTELKCDGCGDGEE